MSTFETGSADALHPSVVPSTATREELVAMIEHLHAALHTNRRIGMALGIVMHELQLDEDEAFDLLRRVSQNHNRKLHDVADDTIYLCRTPVGH